MSALTEISRTEPSDVGQELYGFVEKLFPICRSITGSGIRQTLASIKERIPIETVEVPTGTGEFDWTIPKEWNIRDAYIKSADGYRIVDFRKNNLHVVNYSAPVHATMPLNQLRPHLFTVPDHPDWIPYRTSYYEENWGFCLSHNQLLALTNGDYEVQIDSTLTSGHLAYGELYLSGELSDEVLISCHICHPSLANDNLSGLAVATFLADRLSRRCLRYSYRFLFVPGTIGAITWLARNREAVSRIRHGLVLTCLGDGAGFHYKKSRRSNAEIDMVAAHVLRHQAQPSEILEFSPCGYDERQYCSPGFNLPVGCLMRGVWGHFPEYHTSADNLDFVQPSRLSESLEVCNEIVDVLETNYRYQSNNPYCEPQLGRRGLYGESSGDSREILARLWVLNLADGRHSLLDMAERSGLPFSAVRNAAELLHQHGLLSIASDALT